MGQNKPSSNAWIRTRISSVNSRVPCPLGYDWNSWPVDFRPCLPVLRRAAQGLLLPTLATPRVWIDTVAVIPLRQINGPGDQPRSGQRIATCRAPDWGEPRATWSFCAHVSSTKGLGPYRSRVSALALDRQQQDQPAVGTTIARPRSSLSILDRLLATHYDPGYRNTRLAFLQ